MYVTIQSSITFQTHVAASNLAPNPVPTSWDHDSEPIGNGTGSEHGAMPVFDRGDVEAMPACRGDLLMHGF